MALRQPLSRLQWLGWGLAAAGKLLEGLIVFIGGMALPALSERFGLSPLGQGAFAAASLLGILVGSLALGWLADRIGRRWLFSAELLLLALGLLGAALSPSAPLLLLSLLVVGIALGADYPLAHLVISESVPAGQRGRLVLAAFGCQALGAVLGMAAAAWLLAPRLEPLSWRWLYGLPLLPVLLLAVARSRLPESGPWLQSREQDPQPGGLAPLWAPPLRRALALAALPWFLQDLTTYGVGIYLPQLLQGSRALAAWVELAFLAGMVAAIALVDRWGRITLQITGFLGCAAGLLLAARADLRAQLVVGLLLVQFMTNLGPNAQTYLLAGELFPVALRGRGAGLAAAAGKLGAIAAALAMPVLLQRWGPGPLLPLLAATSLVGAALTWGLRLDTVPPAEPPELEAGSGAS
jgi:MFS transporter, putative metabolite transport protein